MRRRPRSFLGLMVGICDLKPLVFWLTVFEQVDLAHRFAKLPFSLVGKGKPSLDRYRSVIADARNQAFYDCSRSDHPFNVKLPGDALRGPALRLFREYKSRNDPALTFEDRGLVELFEALTRTSERPVPVGFWDGNLHVIGAVTEVVCGVAPRAHRRGAVVPCPPVTTRPRPKSSATTWPRPLGRLWPWPDGPGPVSCRVERGSAGGFLGAGPPRSNPPGIRLPPAPLPFNVVRHGSRWRHQPRSEAVCAYGTPRPRATS